MNNIVAMARFDLHCHTFYSDSFYSPEAVVIMALKRNLDGIAITDHNSFGGVKRAVKFSEKKKIMVMPGEEILTDKGEVIGLFLQKEIPPGDFDDVVEEIRKQGGLVILPHPCDRLRRGVLKRFPKAAEEADGIEIVNARVIFSEDNNKAEVFADRYKKAKTGGSDAHFDFEIGRGWTEFDGEGEEDFRKAINKAKTRAGGSQSPPFVHGLGKVAEIVNRFRR